MRIHDPTVFAVCGRFRIAEAEGAATVEGKCANQTAGSVVNVHVAACYISLIFCMSQNRANLEVVFATEVHWRLIPGFNPLESCGLTGLLVKVVARVPGRREHHILVA